MSAVALPQAPVRSRSGAKGGTLRWVSQLAAWLVILPSIAILLLCVGIPRLAGATPYTILTGSMEPMYPPGTLVVIKPVHTSEIGVGSVITYQLDSGQPAVVTHRVIATRMSQRGETEFRTRGDANNVADAKWVRPVQVRGALWYAVPKMGYLSQMLTGEQRDGTVHVVAYALFGYAGAMVLLAILRPTKPTRVVRRTRADDTTTEAGSPS